jgi:hypothetical protein
MFSGFSSVPQKITKVIKKGFRTYYELNSYQAPAHFMLNFIIPLEATLCKTCEERLISL